MNSSSIDTLLKTTSPAIKPASREAPRDGEFEKHLKEAAAPQPASTRSAPKKKDTAEPSSLDTPTLAGERKQEPPADTEDHEELIVNAEEGHLAAEPDEVLLSVAATAVSVENVQPVEASLILPVLDSGSSEQVEIPDASGATQPQESELPIGEPSAFVPEFSETESTNLDTRADGTVENSQKSPPVGEFAEVALDAVGAPPLPDQVEAGTSQEPGLVSAKAQFAPTQELPYNEKPQPRKAADEGPIEHVGLKVRATAPLVVSAELPVDAINTVKNEAVSQREIEASSSIQATEPSSATEPAQQRTGFQSPAGETNGVDERHSDTQSPTIDRSRFVQRVANAFRLAHQHDGEIQLRLSPPELGSLKIEIAVRHGVLTANLETETADARRVLLDNLPALRQRLAEQDIRIEKFEVEVRRDGGQQGDQAGAQYRQAEQQSQRAESQNRIRTSPQSEVIAAHVPRTTALNTDANLDVRI